MLLMAWHWLKSSMARDTVTRSKNTVALFWRKTEYIRVMPAILESNDKLHPGHNRYLKSGKETSLYVNGLRKHKILIIY